MANNLHISYDLNAPGQNYSDVIARIKELGDWAKVHKSFWYVNSAYTATEAVNHIKQSLDSNDTVYVVDSTNNIAAWKNLSPKVEEFIKERWFA